MVANIYATIWLQNIFESFFNSININSIDGANNPAISRVQHPLVMDIVLFLHQQ
jgi:hypothetical protein